MCDVENEIESRCLGWAFGIMIIQLRKIHFQYFRTRRNYSLIAENTVVIGIPIHFHEQRGGPVQLPEEEVRTFEYFLGSRVSWFIAVIHNDDLDLCTVRNLLILGEISE